MSEMKKPENLPANVMPTDGFVLTVDGKLKTRYETNEQAMASALALKQRYPMIQAAVYDAAKRSYAPVGEAEKPADKAASA